MEKFTIGLVIGGMIGALCVANNYKMRTLVKKGQQEVQEKLDEMMDKTLNSMDGEDEKKEEKPKRSRTKKATE